MLFRSAISADRPYCDIDQNRPQTIRQANVLDHVIRKSVDIRDGEDSKYANRLINEALAAADGHIKGPVHINMQFAMPLTISGSIGSVYSRLIRPIGPHCEVVDFSDCTRDSYLFVGGLRPGQELRMVREYISQIPSNFTVIAEAQSNLSDMSDRKSTRLNSSHWS